MTLNSLRNIDFSDSSMMSNAWYAHFQDHLEIVQGVKDYTGQISGYTVVSGGSGYTASTVATISPPDLKGGTQATATVFGSGGVVTGLSITNVGSGYIQVPTVTITDPGGGTGADITLDINSVKLTVYPIFPYSKETVEDMLIRHQQYHDDFNSVLNLNGTNLQDLDVNDPKLIVAWTNENFYEHYTARQALGI